MKTVIWPTDDMQGNEVVYEDSFIGPIPETSIEAYCRETGKCGFSLREFLEWKFCRGLQNDTH